MSGGLHCDGWEAGMVDFALNHMTVARASYAELLGLAERLGCVGVEVRNDLPQPLFDGLDPARAGAMARDRGLRLLAVAEVKRFNDWSDDKAAEALALMRIARAAGAEAVSLIPRNDNQGMGNGERQAALRVALKALLPMLEDHDLLGMVEPLGFEICALRHKAEAVEAIAAVGGAGRFRLVHDTFHHTLAHGGPVFPAQTGIVHISGVTDQGVALADMRDPHRVLVGPGDRLGNIDQIAALLAAGWTGPVSMESFAPEVHGLADPAAALARSFAHIRDGVAALAA
jgi:2-keto-myo-inositol isomerase